MKKLIALVIVLASFMMANAKSVVFTLSDGTLVYYLLGGETNPVMKFTDGKLVVNTDTYAFSNVKNFYISETDDPNSTAIATAAVKKDASFIGNAFVVKADASLVKVYSVSGAEVEAPINQADGYTSVNMNSLQKGTYVIKVGNASFKVLKK